MNILDQIVENKRLEIARSKKEKSIDDLEASEFFMRDTYSLREFLLDPSKTGIIAEFKRKSPSKGIINDTASVAAVTTSYATQGASGLSVLTDTDFFGGNFDDIASARVNSIPILRKDFMLEEYQVYEARAVGADVILLIAACLTTREVKRLAKKAKSLELEVLLEIHSEEELKFITDDVDLVGVNNRNLKNFEVDIETSIRLSKLIPDSKIMISESGINDIPVIQRLKDFGFRGFLMGEHFMKEPDPSIAFAHFVQELKTS